MGEAKNIYFTCLKSVFINRDTTRTTTAIMSALGAKSLQLTRNAMTVVPRRAMHIETEGIHGSFMPFKIDSPIKSMIGFTLYIGSAFSMPFLMVRHQLKKKSGL